MTSFYSIIQLTADPVADERINLGLIAVEDDKGSLRFTTDVSRAAAFLGAEFRVPDIQRLIDSLRDDLDPMLSSGNPVDLIRYLADRWQRTVRITAPRASLLSMDQLLATVAPRALPTSLPSEPRKRARDRRTAVLIARSTLKNALLQAPQAVKVQNNVTVQGHRQNHRLELGLANGAVRRGITGFSFEGGISPDRERELGALKWLVDDIKTLNQSFPISVVVLSADDESGAASGDLSVLRSLGADVVLEPDLDQWADRVIAAV